jgi:hypothetical protein
LREAGKDCSPGWIGQRGEGLAERVFLRVNHLMVI